MGKTHVASYSNIHCVSINVYHKEVILFYIAKIISQDIINTTACTICYISNVHILKQTKLSYSFLSAHSALTFSE